MSAWPALLAAGLAMIAPAAAQAKPRLVVLTDIGNEPDDQMSLVRLLLYANEIDIEALVATTSTWQRGKVSPEIVQRVIDGYAEALPRLRENAPDWPDAAVLRARVLSSAASYGLAGIAADHPSPGARGLLAARQLAEDASVSGAGCLARTRSRSRYIPSTLARAHGVRRRNFRLDATLGSLLKQRISIF